jgi:hypothetical protein
MHFARLVSLALVLALGACAGGSSPTAPTAVFPSLGGQWTGSYVVASCTDIGIFVGSCVAFERGGVLTLTLSQSGGTVTGTMTFGGVSIPVSGTIGTDAVLSLTGSGSIGKTTTLTLNAWRFTVAGSSMSGPLTFTLFGTDPETAGASGSLAVSATGAMAR